MENDKLFVNYYRVSRESQGADGYGIESQKRICASFLASVPQARLIAEFTEVESGKNNNRPKALAAIRLCQQTGATLCMSKTDRILRSLEFLITLRKSGISIYCCDNPSCDKFSLAILSAIAEKERDDISMRTRNGLAVARERLRAQGRRLGNPDPKNALQAAYAQMRANKIEFAQSIYPHIQAARADRKGRYKTLRDFADFLKLSNVRTARGLTDWSESAIARILEVIEGNAAPAS
jgi:DNA invertase Pin-like site-specific DNA recombinase